MRNREAFVLQRPLFFWNFGLALFSIAGFVRFAEDFFVAWYNNGLEYSLCHSCNPDGVAAFWRKKPLIFLHYYHHAAVLVYTVHSGAEHTAPGQAFITMNYFAHAFMYSYYAYCALGKRLPKWVSMCVTSIQTTQMFLGVAVTCFVYYLKVYKNVPCQQSMANLYLAFLIYITFAVLFVEFFVNAYLKKQERREKKKLQ
uniref:Elongation of very long chain fatty acids protein n=1 Tax=Bursaphelenchus xylophilus TaxID=6326 RepID=A0A1I7SGP0_BURXY